MAVYEGPFTRQPISRSLRLKSGQFGKIYWPNYLHLTTFKWIFKEFSTASRRELVVATWHWKDPAAVLPATVDTSSRHNSRSTSTGDQHAFEPFSPVHSIKYPHRPGRSSNTTAASCHSPSRPLPIRPHRCSPAKHSPVAPCPPAWFRVSHRARRLRRSSRRTRRAWAMGRLSAYSVPLSCGVNTTRARSPRRLPRSRAGTDDRS